MEPIRIVWGTGEGPTEMASYDAALADAGVENYNLVAVSSIVPAGAEIDPVGTAPDLGPAGERLTVVEGRATATGGGTVSAGLGWVCSEEGPGLFYESAGPRSPDAVSQRVLDGLEAGQELRDWTFGDPEYQVVSADVAEDAYTTTVVVAAYGESDPIL
jgi:arginine decarboxylase